MTAKDRMITNMAVFWVVLTAARTSNPTYERIVDELKRIWNEEVVA
jgi:hypothetical protein